MTDETTFAVSSEAVTQLTASTTTVEKFDTDEEDFVWTDRLTATWHWFRDGANDEVPTRGYWLIGGDNTGSQQLIVYPYHLPALRALLARCAVSAPADASAT